MSCCHHYFTATEGGDDAFVVDASRVVFGAGVIAESGDHAKALGMTRVAVFTGEIVAERIIEMMKETLFPNGLAAVGFGAADAGALAEGAFPQQRLLANSPRPVAKQDLASLFVGAMQYW